MTKAETPADIMEETSFAASSSAAAGDAESFALGVRVLAAWEIASVTVSFLIAEWMVGPFAGNSKLVGALSIALAFLLMFFSHRARGETARAVGWRLDNFAEALRLLVVPMLAVASVILLAGWLTGGFRGGKLQVWRWVLWLPLWGLVQQYALQGFVNRRAQILFGRGWRSVLLVACVFALLHLPNPWLTVATFVGGLVWAWVYQRAPNLPALALSHAAASLLLVWALPPTVLKSLRVGFKYFG